MRFKDALPISRSVVEACINIAYILSVGSSATENAIDHAITKGFRKLDTSSGTGKHKISIKCTKSIEVNENLEQKLEAFSTKKGFQKDWTDLSVPKRIIKIEESFGSKHATTLNGAYLMVYSDASEIVHGSYFGSLLSSGMQPFGNTPKDLAEFKKAQERNMESSLLASFLVLHGMLNIFAEHFEFKHLKSKLEENFKGFTELVTADD